MGTQSSHKGNRQKMELDNVQRELSVDQEKGEDGDDSDKDSESRADGGTQKVPDYLDWEMLRRVELRNLFKFNTENRSWWTIVKTSLVIFVTGLGPSLFDMGSDALSTYNFINGTTYTKYVTDLNHSSVNSGLCTHVGLIFETMETSLKLFT